MPEGEQSGSDTVVWPHPRGPAWAVAGTKSGCIREAELSDPGAIQQTLGHFL